MTNTVDDKTNFSITWERVASTRNARRNFSPIYNTLPPIGDGPLAYHAPEDVTFREFRIQSLGYDAQVPFVRIRLQAGVGVEVDFQINKTDPDRDNPKWFQFNAGLGIILPATGRLWVSIQAPNSPNSFNSSVFQCQLWGQVNR